MSSEIRILGGMEKHRDYVVEITGEAVRRVVNDHATTLYGEHAVPDPTDIELTPDFENQTAIFGVRAWHTVGAGAAQDILQPQNFSFYLQQRWDEDFIVVKNEGENRTMHAATFYEASVLHAIAMSTIYPNEED